VYKNKDIHFSGSFLGGKLFTDLEEHMSAVEMKDYRDIHGLRILRGFCDELFEYICKNSASFAYRWCICIFVLI